MKQKKSNVLSSILNKNKTKTKSFSKEKYWCKSTFEGFEILDKKTDELIEALVYKEWWYENTKYYYLFTEREIEKETPIRDFFDNLVYKIQEHFYWNWYVYVGIIILLVVVISGTVNILWLYKLIASR